MAALFAFGSGLGAVDVNESLLPVALILVSVLDLWCRSNRVPSLAQWVQTDRVADDMLCYALVLNASDHSSDLEIVTEGISGLRLAVAHCCAACHP